MNLLQNCLEVIIIAHYHTYIKNDAAQVLQAFTSDI